MFAWVFILPQNETCITSQLQTSEMNFILVLGTKMEFGSVISVVWSIHIYGIKLQL